MKCSLTTLLIILGLFAACSTDITEQSLNDQNVDNINLHVLSNGQVNFQGDIISIADLHDQLEAIKIAEDAVAQFKADGEAAFEDVTDVQSILREKGVLKINYRN